MSIRGGKEILLKGSHVFTHRIAASGFDTSGSDSCVPIPYGRPFYLHLRIFGHTRSHCHDDRPAEGSSYNLPGACAESVDRSFLTIFLKVSVPQFSKECAISTSIHYELLPFIPYFAHVVFGLYYRIVPNGNSSIVLILSQNLIFLFFGG